MFGQICCKAYPDGERELGNNLEISLENTMRSKSIETSQYKYLTGKEALP
jgi:hypothetical protein